MRKTKTKAAAVLMAAAMLLTGCRSNENTNENGGAASGNNTEDISSKSSSTTDAASESDLVMPESSISSTENTLPSSAESSVVQEKPQEKIPLSLEELNEIHFGAYTINYFRTYENTKKEFDFTVSIDTVEKLDFILAMFTDLVECDGYELIPRPMEHDDLEYFYFELETLERHIQEHLLPTFKLSSLDYKKSEYWDSENNRFKVEGIFDGFRGNRSAEYMYLNESGYKVGDDYYVSVVPLVDYIDYPDAELFLGDSLFDINPKMSYISSDFFDIPRVRLKLKKFIVTNEYGEQWEIYMCVGFAPVDERPDWVKYAEKLFKDNDLENTPMIGQQPLADDETFVTPELRTAGVINTPFGKRMYVYEKSYREGTLRFDYGHVITTFGTRGQNDIIEFLMFAHNRQGTGGGAGVLFDLTDSTLTCDDVFSGEKYTYSLEEGNLRRYNEGGEEISNEDIKNESWDFNGKEISEREFISAEIVSYFLVTFKGDGKRDTYMFDNLYSFEFDKCIALADYYEMCRIITE